MTRRDVAAIRRRTLAEEEKLRKEKKGLRRTFVDIGRHIQEKRKSLHLRKLFSQRLSRGAFITLKTAFVSSLLITAILIWAKLIVKEVPDLMLFVKKEPAVGAEARLEAAKVFWASKRSLRDFASLSKRLDEEGRKGCMEILALLDNPEFETAEVLSPKLDPSLCCVVPHSHNGLKVKFLFRKLATKTPFILEGVCLD